MLGIRCPENTGSSPLMLVVASSPAAMARSIGQLVNDKSHLGCITNSKDEITNVKVPNEVKRSGRDLGLQRLDMRAPIA